MKNRTSRHRAPAAATSPGASAIEGTLPPRLREMPTAHLVGGIHDHLIQVYAHKILEFHFNSLGTEEDAGNGTRLCSQKVYFSS